MNRSLDATADARAAKLPTTPRTSSLSHDGFLGIECAQKKPPVRLNPRGAKDTTLFRERLDADDVGIRNSPTRYLSTHTMFSKRATSLLAGVTLRGPQRWQLASPRLCRTSHVDHDDLSVVLYGRSVPWASNTSASLPQSSATNGCGSAVWLAALPPVFDFPHEAARICFLAFRVKGGFQFPSQKTRWPHRGAGNRRGNNNPWRVSAQTLYVFAAAVQTNFADYPLRIFTTGIRRLGVFAEDVFANPGGAIPGLSLVVRSTGNSIIQPGLRPKPLHGSGTILGAGIFCPKTRPWRVRSSRKS